VAVLKHLLRPFIKIFTVTVRLNLKSKFNLLMTAVFLCFTVAAWLMSARVVSGVNNHWAAQFSQSQVQFDKHRTLMPLIREIALARQLAMEPALINMAEHEGGAEVNQQAMSVLERYRTNFQDKSYFFVVAASGNYYFNDAQNAFDGHQKRYQLSPGNKNDQWFYATIKSGKPYQINLDPDINLGVTKVWINVLVEDAGKVVGMVGTGIDITAFLRETVNVGQAGVHNIFVDHDMAIQLCRDASLIDYASVTKDINHRSRVDALLTDPGDIARLRQVMDRVESSPFAVETLRVTFNGRTHLLGVAYLPEIGWFDLTLMDTRGLFMVEDFFMIPVAVSVMLLLAILVFGYVLNRWVIKPVVALNTFSRQIEQGHFDFDERLAYDAQDEIGEASVAFRKMAASLKTYTVNLETRVTERTAELEAVTLQLRKINEDLDQLSRTDKLTQIRNRHDLHECLQIEASRSSRTMQPCGVIMFDIDHFKEVNDHHGHLAGDEVLKAVASATAEVLRSEDILGRWGGEEFLILLPGKGLRESQQVADKVREVIANQKVPINNETITVQISLGVSLFVPGKSIHMDACVMEADLALYEAKRMGRNRVAVHG
jgi:diguanylate cyclase (GGDEF)-like protein